jgi:hypothetical protein
MPRLRPFFIVLALATGLLGTYLVSLQVGTRYDRVQALEKQIKEDRQAIRMLRMELTYLASPQRVQHLSDQFLTLQTPQSQQFKASFDELRPMFVPQTAPEPNVPIVVGAEDLPRLAPEPVVPPPPPAPVVAAAPTRASNPVAAAERVAAQVEAPEPEPKPEPKPAHKAKAEPKLVAKAEPKPKPAASPAPAKPGFLSGEALATINNAAKREDAQVQP